MKKLTIILAILALPMFFSRTASAEYAFSINLGYTNEPSYSFGHNYHPRHKYYHPRHGRAFYPYRKPVVYVKTVGRMGVSERIPKKTVVVVKKVERLGISDIITLSKAGVSDDIIIEKIARTGSVFDLCVEEVLALREEGVSRRVINFMLDTLR